MKLNEQGEFVTQFPKTVKVREHDDWRGAYERRMVKKAWDKAVDTGKVVICDVCGKAFKPVNRRQKRCSFKCQQEANRYMTMQRARKKRREELARRKEILDGDGDHTGGDVPAPHGA